MGVLTYSQEPWQGSGGRLRKGPSNAGIAHRASFRRHDSCAGAFDEAVWDRVAQCESSGNSAVNTGNGYYSGL